ncbi:MAG TPA: TetR/AcrR family transcriptional regulator [Rhizomicrobium sp.]|nr:TetR/AcrR family transcriptional regulator [Rhizomicrobium sp.]
MKAFAEQLSQKGRDTLSPSEAAKTAGVSLRTVHVHFPNYESQIAGLAGYFDARLYPAGVVLAAGPDDLPRYFRDIHTMALRNKLSWVLATNSKLSGELRRKRRAERLEAIRRAVAAIGAPARESEDATAMLLSLSGADASWPLHTLHGLPLKRIPGVIATTVEMIVERLYRLATG